MKKLILVVGLFLLVGVAKAEMCSDLGRVNLCLPITTGIEAGFGYDFKGHRSLGLAETSVGSFKINEDSKLVFSIGGITTEDDRGAPMVGVGYQLKGVKNPIPGVTDIKPGVFAGKNFDKHEFFYGVKANIVLFK